MLKDEPNNGDYSRAAYWREFPSRWIVGCIDSHGAIVGRAVGANMFDSLMHGPEESKGKRWRWCIPEQGFHGTLQDSRRRAGLEESLDMDAVEIFHVMDWLVRNGYADDQTWDEFVEDNRRKLAKLQEERRTRDGD